MNASKLKRQSDKRKRLRLQLKESVWRPRLPSTPKLKLKQTLKKSASKPRMLSVFNVRLKLMP